MEMRHGAASSSWLPGTLLSVAAFLIPHLAGAQGLLDGYWALSGNEDQTEYGPGADEGDYTGVPVTHAAIEFAHTWSSELISVPQMQCEPYGVTYGQRAVGIMHIWEDHDPYTQQQSQIETWVTPQPEHRHIWMTPHPHPPAWAPATWDGYSTGKWVGNVLYVHTDMIKPYYVTRNGLPLDDKTTMDERFFRYGDVLTDVMIISDPAYLSRPLVESKEFNRLPQGASGPYPCRPNDEVPRPEGLLPMHLPGQNSLLQWGPVRVGEPVKAAQGGAETLFPEYQETMKRLPPNPKLADVEKAEKAIVSAGGQTSRFDSRPLQ